MLVRFSDQDEFVKELTRDPNAVARKLVRTTTTRYPIMQGTLTRIAVVGTAKVWSGSLGDRGDYDCVEYQEPIGDLWGGPKDDEVIEATQTRIGILEQKLTDAGFVVAHGRYENEEVTKRGG